MAVPAVSSSIRSAGGRSWRLRTSRARMGSAAASPARRNDATACAPARQDANAALDVGQMEKGDRVPAGCHLPERPGGGHHACMVVAQMGTGYPLGAFFPADRQIADLDADFHFRPAAL